ncbi:MAG: hypothetical protein Q8R88_16870 [Desulfoprunum sp.]|nr:hypothetical protein [Desulfoprunum sp.]
MKNLMTILLVFSFALLLNGCGEWDNLVDSVSGSDDDEATTTTVEAPRKDVSTPTTQPTTTPTTPTTQPSTDGTYKNKATYTSSGVAPANRGGGSTFRIGKKGTAFGKTIKVVFSNGWSVTIPDTSKRFEKNNFIYRAGGGSFRNAETWTSHGGVFICANSGNKSRSLTIFY